jgi:hydrogenase maturation protease
MGNVFLGDDGFGVAVAKRLLDEPLPEGTRVVDFGIRGLHLVFDLIDPPDLLILVDATAQGGAPGTLYLIDPEKDPAPLQGISTDAHAMDAGAVLRAVRQMTGGLPPTRIVGCEPARRDEEMELSAPVQLAVEPAVEMVLRLIQREVMS